MLLESYPPDLEESLARRAEWRRSRAADDEQLEFIVSDLSRWAPGSTVRVAFLDGPSELHGAIAEATRPITESCSLELDFGHDGTAGTYRRWSTSDTEHTAEIRVSFDLAGYWSLVGTASVDPTIGGPGSPSGGRPGQRSLNLGGYVDGLPDGWRGTVLHEFLHALAFGHEHQNTRGPCQDEFRWDDDPGYVPTRGPGGQFVADDRGRRPGIYTYLSGPPNGWPRERVDHNLRGDADDDGVVSAFDRDSVMLYRFGSLFYRSDPSPCAPTSEGDSLSDGDRRGLALLYPAHDDTRRRLAERAAAALAALRVDEDDGAESLADPYRTATEELLERLVGTTTTEDDRS